MGQSEGGYSKEQKISKKFDERILELIWRYQNQNGLWDAFIIELAIVEYANCSELDYLADEEEEALNDI